MPGGRENHEVGLPPEVHRESNPDYRSVRVCAGKATGNASINVRQDSASYSDFKACCGKKLTNGQKCALSDVPL